MYPTRSRLAHDDDDGDNVVDVCHAGSLSHRIFMHATYHLGAALAFFTLPSPLRAAGVRQGSRRHRMGTSRSSKTRPPTSSLQKQTPADTGSTAPRALADPRREPVCSDPAAPSACNQEVWLCSVAVSSGSASKRGLAARFSALCPSTDGQQPHHPGRPGHPHRQRRQRRPHRPHRRRPPPLRPRSPPLRSSPSPGAPPLPRSRAPRWTRSAE